VNIEPKLIRIITEEIKYHTFLLERKSIFGFTNIFLEIEVQGALQVREAMPDGVFIFLTPPDLHELESRIVNRGTDSDEVIKNRMKVAREELCLMKYYDYSVVNDKVENAVQQIEAIIQTEHLRIQRNIESIEEFEDELEEILERPFSFGR